MPREVPPISTPLPPAPDDKHWVAAYASRNGAASNAHRESARRLITLAYILAVSMPPLGFGLGVVIALRFGAPRSKHGAWIILISILASVIWILIIAGGALNTPTNDF
jgi:ABC-type Fe3+ transport system permease subunit